MHDQAITFATFGSLFCFALAAILLKVKWAREERAETSRPDIWAVAPAKPRRAMLHHAARQTNGTVINLAAVRASRSRAQTERGQAVQPTALTLSR